MRIEELKKKTLIVAIVTIGIVCWSSGQALALSTSNVTIDLDELNPKENNCRLENVGQEETTTPTIRCSKVPLFCRSVCEQAKRLSFDARMRRVSSFSFGAYKIKRSLEINLGAGVRRIETDAFNGMQVEEDAVLYINIGGDDQTYDISVRFVTLLLFLFIAHAGLKKMFP